MKARLFQTSSALLLLLAGCVGGTTTGVDADDTLLVVTGVSSSNTTTKTARIVRPVYFLFFNDACLTIVFQYAHLYTLSLQRMR
jgi:hypothetical protein